MEEGEVEEGEVEDSGSPDPPHHSGRQQKRPRMGEECPDSSDPSSSHRHILCAQAFRGRRVWTPASSPAPFVVSSRTGRRFAAESNQPRQS
jgi:hypothetical protein